MEKGTTQTSYVCINFGRIMEMYPQILLERSFSKKKDVFCTFNDEKGVLFINLRVNFSDLSIQWYKVVNFVLSFFRKLWGLVTETSKLFPCLLIPSAPTVNFLNFIIKTLTKIENVPTRNNRGANQSRATIVFSIKKYIKEIKEYSNTYLTTWRGIFRATTHPISNFIRKIHSLWILFVQTSKYLKVFPRWFETVNIFHV